MNFLRVFQVLHTCLSAYVIANDVAEANTDDLPSGAQMFAVEASANTVRVAAKPHTDFGNGASEAGSRVLSLESSRSPLLRREAASVEPQDSEADSRHRYRFQDNPDVTPDAIYSNRDIDPSVAMFLGHLAQRSREHHHDHVHHAPHAAVLLEESRSRTPSASSDSDDDKDEKDDIEDMKRAASGNSGKTVLSHYLQQLDAKSQSTSWAESECAAAAKNITDTYFKLSGKSRATWATAGPASAAKRAQIHTGMFFRHWKIGDVKKVARKLRLGVLSFLATQDAGRVQLHIWTDVDKHDDKFKEIMGPIMQHPEYMDAITITTFDPKAEFAKVPPTVARETLHERYRRDSVPELRSDLYRAIVLYNYGGMWMDADMVLMQDVAPLLGEDWAYLVKGGQGDVEGALLSASKPKSHFTNEYLMNLVMRQPVNDGDADGQKSLLAEILENDPSHLSMHVLPPCFLDSEPPSEPQKTTVLSSDATIGSEFFGKAAALPYRGLFSIGFQDAVKDNSTTDASVLEDSAAAIAPSEFEDDDDQTKPTYFAYHWRANFAAPWSKGSLADVAERTFLTRLNLKNQ